MNNDDLIPLAHEKDDREAYVSRIQSALPNFPKEVIVQWFYDHHYQAVADYAWLQFEKFSFRKVIWNTNDIPVTNIGNDGCIQLYSNNYATGRTTELPRFKRIGEFFIKHGSWPVPPIFLENPDADLKFEGGFPFGSPYHLIEGHNRMAQFIYFKSKNMLQEKHEIFLATILR